MPKEETQIKTRARRDVILIGAVVLVVCFAVPMDPDRVFERLAQRRAVQLDGFLVAVVVIGAGFAIFSWHRWTDLSRQVAEYRRLQMQLRTDIAKTRNFRRSCMNSTTR